MAGPRTTVEAQAFYRMYHSYADIPNPWDRLRWCRYGLDLLQKEVAAMVGMEEWLYRDLESGAFHRSFTPELADKLAALYGIPVEDILDGSSLLPSGGKPWFRFSIYASHVRYGNFSPAKRKSSSASHDMWQRRRAFVMESFCFNYSDIRSDLHGVP